VGSIGSGWLSFVERLWKPRKIVGLEDDFPDLRGEPQSTTVSVHPWFHSNWQQAALGLSWVCIPGTKCVVTELEPGYTWDDILTWICYTPVLYLGCCPLPCPVADKHKNPYCIGQFE